MTGNVLLLCNRTANLARPFIDAGFHVVSVDLQEADAPMEGRTHVLADVRMWKPDFHPVFIGAMPPCTHVAVSGAKHFRVKKLPKLIEALQILDACRTICEDDGHDCPFFIENPVSVFASYWRKPDHYFDPSQFTGWWRGDHYSKKTCLWTGGGFRMPEPFADPCWAGIPPDDRIHKAPPSAGRGDVRSVFPVGFSRAVCAANLPLMDSGEAA